MKRQLLALAALALAACSHRIRIEHSQPPVLQLPQGARLALKVEADGTPPSAATVIDTAVGITQGSLLNKWLAVPVVHNEFNSRLREDSLQLVDPAQAQVVIRVVPTQWFYSFQSATAGAGRLDAKIEVIDLQRNQSLYSYDFWATSEGKAVGEPEALARAANKMAGRFLRDLKPRRVSQVVTLDDSDPIVETGIKLCKQGQFEAAHAAFSDNVAAAPNSPAALYNLAVIKESRGEYDQAEELLGRATRIAPKPLYYQAIERVRASRQDAQAMQPAQ